MPLAFQDAPIPLQDPIADKQGQIQQPWIEWLSAEAQQVSASAFVKNSVLLTAQAASISPTDFSGGDLASGLYRCTMYWRITQAATTSSSLSFTFTWTESGVTLSLSSTALTTNTTATGQTGTVMIRSDAASPISYSTTYASSGATPMQYRLDVVLEQVKK